jgi:diguanylate cyclase (GGDEF)-like protein
MQPEAILRSLLHSMPNCSVGLFDHELRLQMAEGAPFDFVAPRDELLGGRPFPSFLTPTNARLFEHNMRAVLGGERRNFAMYSDGGAMAFEVAAVPVGGPDGSIVGGLYVAWDETERRCTADELARRLAQQSAVARLGELALHRGGARELMEGACRTAAEALGVEVVFVAQQSADGALRVGAAVGCGDELVGTSLDLGRLGDARQGPLVIDDLAKYPELDAGMLREQGIVSGAVVVVGEPGNPEGLLGAYTRDRRTFSPHDLDFLHSVAHVVTSAVEQHRTQRRIRHDSLHDALTGLPNRTLLRDRLTGALARTTGRAGWRVALLCVDIDRLKVFNESLGYDAGDQLLRAIGPRLQQVLRPGDTISRFSGDGFNILCEAIADEAHAARIGERIVSAFDAPFAIDGVERFITASVGIAVATPDNGTDDLLANAEAAMYSAKERGRGRHEFHDAAQRARVAARLRTEHDLRGALQTEQLWVAYQPIHRVGGGIAAVEALARWEHPVHGEVPPSDFVPIAEECGLIGALGSRVLRDACHQVARWRAATPVQELALSVNVSARQVTAPGLVEEVAAVLAESGLAPGALWLELTEGLLLEDSSGVIETLRALRDLGVRIVLDDFGTGYSSLGYLRRYPIDVLKIDRTFIADLGEDGAGDAAIVAAIVGMAHALGMETVPEGVETAGQFERLVALDCDYVQGYHLGRPLPGQQLETLLMAGSLAAVARVPAPSA